MKNRNLLKSFVSLVLILTLTFAFEICSFAAVHNEYESNEVEDVSSISFSKTLKTDVNVTAPYETFKIKMTEGNGGGTYDGQSIKSGILSAFGTDSDNDGILYFYLSGGDSAVVSDDGSYQTYSYSGSASIYGSVFESAGIYEYVVSEVDGGSGGMNYDNTTYYLYVIVLYCGEDEDDCGNGNGLYIASVFATEDKIESVSVSNGKIYDDDGNEVTIYKSGLNFENSETTINVTIKKSIEGNMADKSESFSFTVTLKVDVDGESFYYEIFDSSNTRTKYGYITVNSDGTYSLDFSLGDDEYIVIYGLSSGDSYTVRENLTDTSYTVYINDDDMSEAASTTYSYSGAGNETNNVTVSYLNYKNVNTPTGIVLNYLPYLLLLACAGVVGFVFFRRRRANY